jgi:hypothetical protein
MAALSLASCVLNSTSRVWMPMNGPRALGVTAG